MSDDEAVKLFKKEISGEGKRLWDAENAHGAGDTFIEIVLREHGFPKLAAAYNEARSNWWYA